MCIIERLLGVHIGRGSFVECNDEQKAETNHSSMEKAASLMKVARDTEGIVKTKNYRENSKENV